jgi:hypothetical protein
MGRMVDGRVIDWTEDNQRFDRFIYALVAAAGLHSLIFLILSYTPPAPLLPILDISIPVRVIEQNQPVKAPTAAPASSSGPFTAAQPVSPPSFAPPPIPEPSIPAPQPQPTPQPKPAVPAPTPLSVTPNIIAGPTAEEEEDETDKTTAPQSYVPSRWALEPALSKPRLEGLFGEGFEKDINCVRSLSEDCTALRKEVFADYQLTEQDLIWTESFAHSGLTSPELYGLSERQIRKKLGVPIAGDNGFVILPGIAIDGNLWDTLHGVNKKCPVLRGVRKCPSLRPKADDKRFNIPKR